MYFRYNFDDNSQLSLLCADPQFNALSIGNIHNFYAELDDDDVGDNPSYADGDTGAGLLMMRW